MLMGIDNGSLFLFCDMQEWLKQRPPHFDCSFGKEKEHTRNK